jgi:thiol:disulfide interchange protein
VKIFRILPILGALTIGFNAKSQKMNFLKIQEVSFEEVLKKAKKENKMVFMDIYAVWCGPCKVMDKTTFSDSLVATKFNREFIAYKVNADDVAGGLIVQKYQVEAYPTYLFFSPEGELINRLEGIFPSKLLMEEADYSVGLWKPKP